MTNVCRSVCESLLSDNETQACMQYCDVLERGALHTQIDFAGPEDTWRPHDEVVPIYGWSDPSAAGTNGAYLCRQPGSFFEKQKSKKDSHFCSSFFDYVTLFESQEDMNPCKNMGIMTKHTVTKNNFTCRNLSCKQTCPNLYTPGSSHPHADTSEGAACAPHRDDFPDNLYGFADGQDVQARWKEVGKTDTKHFIDGTVWTGIEMKCKTSRRPHRFYWKDGKHPPDPDDLVPPCLLQGKRAAYKKPDFTWHMEETHFRPENKDRWLSAHDQTCIDTHPDQTIEDTNQVDIRVAEKGKDRKCAGSRRVRCAYRLSKLHPSQISEMLNVRFYDDRKHVADDDFGGTIDQNSDIITVKDAIQAYKKSQKQALPFDTQYAMQVRNANKALWYQCMLPWTQGCPEGRSICTVYESQEFGELCRQHMAFVYSKEERQTLEQRLQGEMCFFNNDTKCPIYTDWKINARDFDGHIHGQVVRVPKAKAVDQNATHAYASTLIEMYNLHDCDQTTHDYDFTVLSTRRDRKDNLFLSTVGTCVPKGSTQFTRLEQWARFMNRSLKEDGSGEIDFAIKTPAEKSRWNGYLVSPCTTKGKAHPGAPTCCAGTARDGDRKPHEVAGRVLMIEDEPKADGNMHEALAVKCVSTVFGENFDKIHSCETTESDLIQTIRKFMECEGALRQS